MSDDVKSRLEERKKAMEEEFGNLDVEEKGLIEKGRTINQRLNEIRTRKVQLQGGFSEVTQLLNDGEPEELEEEPAVEESPEE